MISVSTTSSSDSSALKFSCEKSERWSKGIKTDDIWTVVSHFLSLALFLHCSLFSHWAQSDLAALGPVYIWINVFRLRANFCMCRFHRTRAHACARDLTASRPERAANDQWLDWSVWLCVRVCLCVEGVCVEDQDSRGGSQPENRTAWTSSYPRGLWGPTPVLLPHVRGMRRLMSVIQAHVCPNRTQLQPVCICTCMWETANMAHSLKWGVALTSETNHLCACIMCPQVPERLSVMKSIMGVLPLESHCYIYHCDYNAITASIQRIAQRTVTFCF